MKKVILPVAGLVVTTASTTSAIGCIRAAYTQGDIGERVVLITDAGRVSDKSFNQNSYEGIIEYANREPQTTDGSLYGGFNFQKRGLSAAKNYVQPLQPDTSGLISAYKVAYVKGVDILVLSGFQHAATVDIAADIIGSDKTIIFIDSNAGSGPNIINLVYNSQLAGFAAGYNAAVWATTKNEKDGKMLGDIRGNGIISFGTYGGVSSKFAVDSYMWGFMVAIRYFNMRMEHDSEPQERQRHVYFANAGFKKDIQDATNISGTNPSYFSGSFEPGGATKSGTNASLYDRGKADVIFPVAGPQTADTLAFSDRAYIVGVDTDQTKQYPKYAHRFVTSALKNLQKSVQDAIDHSKANKLNQENGSPKPQPAFGGEYWDGKIAPAQVDWSLSVDQTMSLTGSKIPKTLVNFENPNLAPLVEEMVDFYNKAGEEAKDYMTPSKIEKMAQTIYDKYRDYIGTKLKQD